VLLDLPGFRDAWRFRSAEAPECEVRISGAVTVSTALALRHCARLGLGPALLADWLVDDDLAGGRLLDLFPEHEVAARDFATAAWLVYPSRRQLPARTRAVIDFLRRSLRAR
jgi:DNA-binding transcriptional LysR family regulator